jgi:hypothetical protein
MPKEGAPIQPFPKAHSRCVLAAAALFLGTLPAACGGRQAASDAAAARGEPATEAGYRPPPDATLVQRLPGGAILLGGVADPASRVRLASPGGAITQASVDARGGWRARLAPSADVRLFGLAAVEHGRTVQAEGYLAVTPGGIAAQLRAGAGALVLAGRGPLRILALDYDRKGGAVLSGTARPGASLAILADETARGRASVGADGRFAMAFDEPLASGVHRLAAVDGPNRAEITASLTPAAALTRGPYRAEQEPSGWRIDWLTPGGGLQTTLLPSSQEAPT